MKITIGTNNSINVNLNLSHLTLKEQQDIQTITSEYIGRRMDSNTIQELRSRIYDYIRFRRYIQKLSTKCTREHYFEFNETL